MPTITRASTEWFRRPDDERFLSLDELHAATLARSQSCESVHLDARKLQAHGAPEPGGHFLVDEPGIGIFALTDWSLGQVAALARTPARWLKEIALAPRGPALAAEALNLGLQHLSHGGKVQLLNLTPREGGAPAELRGVVGEDYGRIFDYEVVAAVREMNEDGRWHTPAASYQATDPKRATTLYASDRDVFIFLVDEANPITVKVDGGQRHLFRGFMVWNSEVGHHRFGLLSLLYDFVCDNRMVHGAREVKELSIRHTKRAPARFADLARPALRAYAEGGVREIEAELARATQTKVGGSDEEVTAWLLGYVLHEA